MKKTLFVGAVCGVAASCAAPGVEGPDVEVFAPGVISTDLPEFAISFTPDGNRAFFNRMSSDRRELHLWTVQRQENDQWGPPEPVAFSTRHRYVDPFVVADGSLLLLSSNRDGAHADDYNTWVVFLSDSGWSEPRRFDEALDSDSADIYITASAEHRVVFTSERDGTRRVWSSRYSEETGWSEPEPLTFGTTSNLGNPTISRDGSMIVGVFETQRGGADLAVSCRNVDGSWSDPSPLPPTVNSEFTEFAPAWGPAGEFLYFTSERPGQVGEVAEGVRRPGDIYRVAVADLNLCP